MKHSLALFMFAAWFCAGVLAQDLSAWSKRDLNNPDKMLAYIAAEQPGEGLPRGAWLENKDRLLRQLVRRDPPVPNLADRLIAIANEETCDVATRDYVMQYLQIDVLRKSSMSDRDKIRDFMTKMIAKTDSPAAATGLLLCRFDRELTEVRVASRALEVIADEKALPLNRAVALQVLAQSQPEVARSLGEQMRIEPSAALANHAVEAVTSDDSNHRSIPCGVHE